MHDWDRLMSGVVARFVMDPVPVRVEHLISGRWSEDADGMHRERQAALSRDAGRLYDSMRLYGQNIPVVARYQVGIDIPEVQLWPGLKINPPVLSNLAKRMLVYEGNHRLAVAKTLRWPYVLVEPRLWVWRGKDVEIGKEEARDRLSHNVLSGLGSSLQWREEKPFRGDGRPMEPESPDRNEKFIGTSESSACSWMISMYAKKRASGTCAVPT